MENLTPEQTGSSSVALAIAKRILRQPAMSVVCDDQSALGNFEVFCGHIAREIDEELTSFGLTFRLVEHPDKDITLTPSERGKLDGILAKEKRRICVTRNHI